MDEAFFLGGVSKDKVLQAFGAQMFFDDQEVHVKSAAQVVPSGRVPYAGGALDAAKKGKGAAADETPNPAAGEVAT